MTIRRQNSLEDGIFHHTRWAPILSYTIDSFLALRPNPYPLDREFLDKSSPFGGKSRSQEAQLTTWACRTNALRQVRAASVEAGPIASVLNFLVSPNHRYDLPFFGADFVTLPSGHLIALDFQPVLKNDPLHTEAVWKRLMPLHSHWQSLLPSGGKIPEEATQYFSPGFLWSRIPLGEEGEGLIAEVLIDAYKQYLSLYFELLFEAKEVDPQRSSLLLAGQQSYMRYRAEKDPARGLLSRLFGADWTEAYIHEALFDL